MEYHPGPLPPPQNHLMVIPPASTQDIPVFGSLSNPPPSFTHHHRLYSVSYAHEQPVNFTTGQSPIREPFFTGSSEQCAETHLMNKKQEGGKTKESRANKIPGSEIYQSPAEHRRMKHMLSQREYRLRKGKQDGARTEAYETIIKDLSTGNNQLRQQLEDALNLNRYLQDILSAKNDELVELKGRFMEKEEE